MTAFDETSIRILTMGLQFPEGPVLDADGSVLVPEIEGGSVTRVRPDGTTELFADCGGGANGAAFGPDGALYICNDGGFIFETHDDIRVPVGGAVGNQGGSLQRVDPGTGAVEVVFNECNGVQIGGLNDIVFDESGSCYFVDTGRGIIYYGDPLAGTIAEVAGGLEIPNGAGLSPDGTRLYVSETFTGHIVVWDVTGPGALGERSDHFVDETLHGWDGLAIDGAGNVCAANLKESGISVINPSGELIDAFVTTIYDPYVTNVCFGEDTAYVASGGRGVLYAVTWPWPGLRLHFQP